MSGGVRVRAAQHSDAIGIADVHVDTWRAAYSGILPKDYLVSMTKARQTSLWEASIRHARGPAAVLVAEGPGIASGNEIIGFGNCGRARRGGATGEVFTLYVANDWQSQGIGRALLGQMFNRLREHGLNEATIWVLSENPARFFYEAMGGKRLAERREPFSGMVLDETAYGWSDLAGWVAARMKGGQ